MITRRKRSNARRIKNDRLRDKPKAAPLPIVDYMRSSKADGSQTLDFNKTDSTLFFARPGTLRTASC
jgi:hypothetical protein